jgi:hypothetical protein
MILAISGRIGSGKDTVGNIIEMLATTNDPTVNWEIKKYAGKLKEIACMLTGCTLEQLEDQDFKKKELSSEWQKVTRYKTYDELTHNQKERIIGVPTDKYLVPEEWIPDYRWLLQTLGTEAMRNGLHENVWVNALYADYTNQNWIITDMRFPNEFDAVKSRNGITIRVNRDDQTKAVDVNAHSSENALDNHEFDHVINNTGSMSDLITKVREILTQNQII